MSQAEEILAAQLDDAGLRYIREHRFHPSRKWRFDFSFREAMLAVEVEGGLLGRPLRCHVCGVIVHIRTKDGRSIIARQAGGHNTGAGFRSDLEKYQEALRLGWRVLRVSTEDVKRGKALALIRVLILDGVVYG